ncbi:glycoside hydrolase family 65 protein [Parenemella sanctibonifatiensis]|uniref:Family 65 glycosyl hydrolase n=1 Tax=Parenemella sanctibonifatiensis TaxID=2016505 RepID=A0A255ESX2_9ACTN|nr:glycosyl hydrolase family 65 protein [Parenemella sanctibonifatiensis]OYN92522.1 family 65 glycosyl hydrolase [Parenemella sanctibonifatiensis]
MSPDQRRAERLALLDRSRFPADEWALRETRPELEDLGSTETTFAVGNGYLGIRATPEEARPTAAHGTFLNGVHETYPIQHAEEAYGFARTGQTMITAPDATVMKLYVDDEPLNVWQADLSEYERELDFRTGVLTRSLVWRTSRGSRVRVVTRRLVSMTQRHLAIMSLEVTLLDGDGSVVISSQLLNRQDGKDEYSANGNGHGANKDPRRAAAFEHRVLQPKHDSIDEKRAVLGYLLANSGMTLAAAVHEELLADCEYEVAQEIYHDVAKHIFTVEARQGVTVSLVKYASYHSAANVPVHELVDRAGRTLDRAVRFGLDQHLIDQADWYARYWEDCDVRVADNPEVQQAIRWNLFQLAQASARAESVGIPAKGVTGSGYSGHYFWDTEIYVLPFLTYNHPELARNALRFRHSMLGKAKERAGELAVRGALFPWRTINGEEASAYYAAGTAQYHIDADISYALCQYVLVSGDEAFMRDKGIDILVETARMWADLGFFRVVDGVTTFHIHGVTGPDEYTTVVNDNLFTNVMAKSNLENARYAVDQLAERAPEHYAALKRRLDLTEDELDEWQRAADAMAIPYDETMGVHPQDAHFLEGELWDLDATPDSERPLLLHFHPLVIYRHQVLKQADVVIALFLQGHRFTLAEKRADFDYYDPITTGDSSLSAVVQSIVAAEVGYEEEAMEYFRHSLYTDLADLHRNTVDGVHVASCGGVWCALVQGFGGMRTVGSETHFDPRVSDELGRIEFSLKLNGVRLRFAATREHFEASTEEGSATIWVRGVRHEIDPEHPLSTELVDHRAAAPEAVPTHRSDGSLLTARKPTPMPLEQLVNFDDV